MSESGRIKGRRVIMYQGNVVGRPTVDDIHQVHTALQNREDFYKIQINQLERQPRSRERNEELAAKRSELERVRKALGRY